MRYYWSFIFLLPLFLLSSFFFKNHSSQKSQQELTRDWAQSQIEPYLKNLAFIKQRQIASEPKESGQIAVDLANRSAIYIQEPNFEFESNEIINPEELLKLQDYIASHRGEMGAPGTLRFRLKYLNQFQVKDAIYVRFQQVVQRSIRRSYFIEVEGATVVARIQNKRLVRLNSNLKIPPQLDFVSQTPGLRFDFSDNEMSKLMTLIKSQEEFSTDLRTYMNVLATKANRPINFDAFLNREVPEQKVLLNYFFSKLDRFDTARLLVDLATKGNLSLIQYESSWMMQATSFLNLPIQFDIEIPDNHDRQLVVRNFRELYHKVTPIRGFQSPFFPGGQKVEGGEVGTLAATRMQQVVNYFSKNFGWTSYGGKNSELPIDIHTQLKNIDFRENAAWLSSVKKLIVGEGGDRIYNLPNSVSVLGHEYSHAILQFGSGLVYRSQAGAINEHFADIQGASIEAYLNNQGLYGFTVGQDVLRPEIKSEKLKLLDLILLNSKYSEEQIRNFSLRKVGLRHLFAPALSFATQYDHIKDVTAAYTDHCQPSVDNDNCGVHTASGVPNKAASLIISILGLEPTRELFFNTVVYRLRQDATFTDYLIQLYQECLSTPNLANRCDVILASFAVVGVNHPDFKISNLSPEPVQPKSNLQPPAPEEKVKMLPDQATTPTIKLCGWIQQSADGSHIRIVDNKFNAILAKRNYPVKTSGDYSALSAITCGCVDGHLTQTSTAQNKLQNLFLDVSGVQDRGQACLQDPKLRALKPPPVTTQAIPVSDQNLQIEKNYCGWISINSKSKNITILDNRFDPVILVSGYNNSTQGQYQSLYEMQCACVKGRLAQTQNSNDVVFNYFSVISKDGITKKSPESCVGLQWK